MVFPQDICYVVQFHWLKYDPLGYATYMLWRHWFQLEMTKMLHHCMCFWPLILCSWFLCPVLWESLLKGIKSIHIFQVCMLKLSLLSKFLHGRWRKKLWCLCFSEQKAVSTPSTSQFHTTVITVFKLWATLKEKSFLQQEVSHQFLFTIETNCLLWAAGLWYTFQPQQFGMQSPLWQQLNASVNGDSISETHCLLWAAWLWDTFQPKQFGTQSLLLQWLNESVEGDSLSETHCLLWAAWLWDTFQPKQFGMQSLL